MEEEKSKPFTTFRKESTMIKNSVILLSLLFLQGCVSFAPPSPLVTFGGPAVVDTAQSEVGLAVGTGVAMFPGAHSGGQGWFGRYKRGIAPNFDLGVDAVGIVRSDKETLTAKVVGRYQVSRNVRLEAGLGLADDSDGKSVNGDVAVTFGTVRETTWNYYGSLRLGAAKGYPGDILFGGGGDQAPVNALFPIVNLGTQAKVAANERFIFEGGFGCIFPEQQRAGALIYLSCGMLFDI